MSSRCKEVKAVNCREQFSLHREICRLDRQVEREICKLKAAQNRFELQRRKKVGRKPPAVLPPLQEERNKSVEKGNGFLKRPTEILLSKSLTSLPPLVSDMSFSSSSNGNAREKSYSVKRAPSDPTLLRDRSENAGVSFATDLATRRISYAGMNVATKTRLQKLLLDEMWKLSTCQDDSSTHFSNLSWLLAFCAPCSPWTCSLRRRTRHFPMVGLERIHALGALYPQQVVSWSHVLLPLTGHTVAVTAVGRSGIQFRERLITNELFVPKCIQLPVNSVNVKPVHERKNVSWLTSPSHLVVTNYNSCLEGIV